MMKLEQIDNEVTISASALEAYGEAMTLIYEAYRWAEGTDITWEQVESGEGEKIVADRRERVAEMERSFYRHFTSLITVSQKHDGPLHLSRDGLGSIYFRHAKSGYHGALIFHPDYKDGTERLPVGLWSTHT